MNVHSLLPSGLVCGWSAAASCSVYFVSYQAPVVEEVTPVTLPRLLSKGKSLAILILDGSHDDATLLKEFTPPKDITPAWLNYSCCREVLKDLGHVYGTALPALIVMDFAHNPVSMLR